MAQYFVTHSCGHQRLHNLFGAKADRIGRQEWLSERPCLDCLKAEEEKKRDEKFKAANRRAKKLGFVELDGTDKQKRWAVTIRDAVIDQVDSIIAKVNTALHDPQSESYAEMVRQVPAEKMGEAIDRYMLFRDWLTEQISSKWWIEGKDVSANDATDSTRMFWALTSRPGPKPVRWEPYYRLYLTRQETEAKAEIARQAREAETAILEALNASERVEVWSGDSATVRCIYVDGKMAYDRAKPGQISIDVPDESRAVEVCKDLCKKWKRNVIKRKPAAQVN